MIPTNFEEWKFCIEKKCGLSLTPTYIKTRVAELKDEQNSYTKEFIRLYGKEYQQTVISWFERAAAYTNA